MTDALARYGPTQPSAAGNTTLITAGAAGTSIAVRHIHIVNTSAAAAWITLGIGGVTAALALLYQYSIPAGGYYDLTGNIPLLGGASPDTLLATQQTAGALTVTIGAVSTT